MITVCTHVASTLNTAVNVNTTHQKYEAKINEKIYGGPEVQIRLTNLKNTTKGKIMANKKTQQQNKKHDTSEINQKCQQINQHGENLRWPWSANHDDGNKSQNITANLLTIGIVEFFLVTLSSNFSPKKLSFLFQPVLTVKILTDLRGSSAYKWKQCWKVALFSVLSLKSAQRKLLCHIWYHLRKVLSCCYRFSVRLQRCFVDWPQWPGHPRGLAVGRLLTAQVSQLGTRLAWKTKSSFEAWYFFF